MGQEFKSVEILLVEDNPVDVLVTKRALQGGNVCNNLHVVQDGEEAMDEVYPSVKTKKGPF